MAKKKVLSSGRFGARYGKRIRALVDKIEKNSRAKHRCPFCDKEKKVRRVAYGIWECKSCGKKFVGKAYIPY